MFIDHAKIFLYAGKGGDGCIGFRREKYVPKGGPNGGDGGKGASIIIKANSNLQTLMDFRYKNIYKAPKGETGKGGMKNGKDGQDVIIKVPCGTQIFLDDTDELLVDLLNNGDEFIAAKGGKGGKGNTWFATPTQRTPRYAEQGKKGEEKVIRLELKLIADVGLVGFPNSGKSTFISVVSHAKPKIADYPFTTLVPNLGVVYYKDTLSFSLADIPGIIEGASEGKGLGLQFLQHIERTKVMLFLLEPFSEDTKKDYKLLLNELKEYNSNLLKKPKIICITKADAIDEDRKNELKKLKIDRKNVFVISAHSGEGMNELMDKLAGIVLETE
jgi:GTP-binding protein